MNEYFFMIIIVTNPKCQITQTHATSRIDNNPENSDLENSDLETSDLETSDLENSDLETWVRVHSGYCLIKWSVLHDKYLI